MAPFDPVVPRSPATPPPDARPRCRSPSRAGVCVSQGGSGGVAFSAQESELRGGYAARGGESPRDGMGGDGGGGEEDRVKGLPILSFSPPPRGRGGLAGKERRQLGRAERSAQIDPSGDDLSHSAAVRATLVAHHCVPPSYLTYSAPRTPYLTQSCRVPVLEPAMLLDLPKDLMRRRSRPLLLVVGPRVRLYLGRVLPLRTLWCAPASCLLLYLVKTLFPS